MSVKNFTIDELRKFDDFFKQKGRTKTGFNVDIVICPSFFKDGGFYYKILNIIYGVTVDIVQIMKDNYKEWETKELNKQKTLNLFDKSIQELPIIEESEHQTKLVQRRDFF